VTLALAVAVFLTTGIRFGVGPLLKPIVAEFGIDRSSFSLSGVAPGLAATGPVVASAVISALVRPAPGYRPLHGGRGLDGRHELAGVGGDVAHPHGRLAMSLLAAHGVPMLTDHGYHAMAAPWALGVLGASSMVGAMLLGAIADRLGRRPVLAWLYATRALLLAAPFLVPDRPGALVPIAALGGTSMSGSLAMTSALTADIFGRFSVGSIFGSIFLVHQAGAAIGSWLRSVLFDLSGGYGLAFGIACTQLLAGAIVSIAIDERVCCSAALSPVAGGR
jgi:predicted MFS family arabinose efflux permease